MQQAMTQEENNSLFSFIILFTWYKFTLTLQFCNKWRRTYYEENCDARFFWGYVKVISSGCFFRVCGVFVCVRVHFCSVLSVIRHVLLFRPGNKIDCLFGSFVFCLSYLAGRLEQCSTICANVYDNVVITTREWKIHRKENLVEFIWNSLDFSLFELVLLLSFSF